MFLQDRFVLPFSEVLDWTRASITIPSGGVYQVHATLEGISAKRQEELRQQVSLTTDSVNCACCMLE